MQDKFVMRLLYVGLQYSDIDMQHNYVNMLDDYVNKGLKFNMLHVNVITWHTDINKLNVCIIMFLLTKFIWHVGSISMPS